MVSIIIPSFNKALFLDSTIKSVLSQTYQDWELIIIDDGSTDDSWNILESFASNDSRIHIYNRNRNPKGANTCRNIGINQSSGKYVIFLDADDLLVPFCLESRMKAILMNPSHDFYVFPIGTFDEKVGDRNKRWLPKIGVDHLSQFLRHDLPWHTSSTIWEKQFITDLGGFDEDFLRLQDVEMHTRALINMPKYKIMTIAELEGIGFYYRIGERNLGNNSKHLTSCDIFLASAKAYLIKFHRILGDSNNKKIIELKGTFFAAVNHALTHGYRFKTIPEEKIDSRIEIFITELSNVLQLRETEKIIIQLYISGFRKGFWRLKGFNWISKQMFILA